MPSRRQGRRRRQTADRVRPTRAAAVPWRERHPAAQVGVFPVKQGAEARDNGSVVVTGVVGRAVRREHAEEVVGAGGRAEEEQQPGRLQVAEGGDAL